MTLAQKLLQQLANTSSNRAIAFEQLVHGHDKENVGACLRELSEQKEVYSCKITKNGKTTEVWWKTGSVEVGNKFMRRPKQ